MSVTPTFVRPPTAQEAVLAALRGAIAAGELPPGRPIRQEQLAARYGVSRVPIREALRILEGEGQVTHLPHRGYVVAELSVADLEEVYLIRGLLEPEAVRAAVRRMSDDDVDRLAALLSDVEAAGRAGDVPALTVANRAFHFALFEASGMPRLVRIIRLLWDSSDVYRSVYFGKPANRAVVDREHRALLAAVRARDADGAVASLAEHREHAVVGLARALRGGGPS